MKKLIFQIAVWWYLGGYPPIDDKDAFRKWLIRNLKNHVMPIVEWTDTKWDDTAFDLILNIVETDSTWNTVWEIFANGAIDRNELIKEISVDPDPRLLHRIRRRIGVKRKKSTFPGEDFADQSTNQEAESVAMVAILVSIIANGPFALLNMRNIIQRIINRGGHD